ncbi:hypothetical protein DPX39_080018100 [Trypanosoma brucei equiperdum]|uniref:Uncharacterized protein n=1 Tax=Trypanosoma brucei equiperdum TaxID=630700 RepID=A0A3L6L340_9TRYP|nr:hypothetical protein DPX39_080018100 [Trypanosoma brucei equiperdum]
MHSVEVMGLFIQRQRRWGIRGLFFHAPRVDSRRFIHLGCSQNALLRPSIAPFATNSFPLTHQKQHQHHSQTQSQYQPHHYHHKQQHHHSQTQHQTHQHQHQHSKQQQQQQQQLGRFSVLRPFRSGWNRFCSQCRGRKCLIVAAACILGCCSYVVLCLALWWRQQEAVGRLFSPLEEHPLEEWSLVEPTLREGDIILMMGTGEISSKITAAQYVYSGMRAAALRYSHVAVVVEPAHFDRLRSRRTSFAYDIRNNSDNGSSRSNNNSVDGNIADSVNAEYGGMLLTRPLSAGIMGEGQSLFERRPRRGAVIMEAIDNIDVNAPDVNGHVRHNCVQLVEASRRLFGRHDEKWCYRRFAVRRLKGFEWTPQRKRLLREFINENVGRPLDTNSALMLSYIHPRLYEWVGGRPHGNEISCGELIVDLYKHCGVIRRRERPITNSGVMTSGLLSPTPVTSAVALTTSLEDGVEGNKEREKECVEEYYARPSIQTAPYQFAEGEEVGVLDFAEGISLGPEVRMCHPYATQQS